MKSSVFRISSRKRSLKDSSDPFSHFEPGVIWAVLVVVLSTYLPLKA
jgi:hypothetical protein